MLRTPRPPHTRATIERAADVGRPSVVRNEDDQFGVDNGAAAARRRGWSLGGGWRSPIARSKARHAGPRARSRCRGIGARRRALVSHHRSRYTGTLIARRRTTQYREAPLALSRLSIGLRERSILFPSRYTMFAARRSLAALLVL